LGIFDKLGKKHVGAGKMTRGRNGYSIVVGVGRMKWALAMRAAFVAFRNVKRIA